MKLSAKGHTFVFEYNAVVRHDYRRGLGNFVRTFYRYGTGSAYVMGKRARSG